MEMVSRKYLPLFCRRFVPFYRFRKQLSVR